jgi:hypothetical protein
VGTCKIMYEKILATIRKSGLYGLTRVAYSQPHFYLRHNKSNQANLDRVFSEFRSGTIAHKNKKTITADTQCILSCR